MQIKIVNKPDIINSHILLQIRWGHISFLKLNVFNSDLCSLFSFTYCWNFSWVFTEALTEIFKLAIPTFPREKPGQIATLANPCVVISSQKVLPSLWRGVLPCHELPSWPPGNTSILATQGSSFSSSASPEVLPGSCTAPSTGNSSSLQLRLSGFKNDPVPRFDASKQQPFC